MHRAREPGGDERANRVGRNLRRARYTSLGTLETEIGARRPTSWSSAFMALFMFDVGLVIEFTHCGWHPAMGMQ